MLLTRCHKCFLCLSLLLVLRKPVASQSRTNAAIFERMETLTKTLGKTFFEFSNGITKFNELRDSFSKSAESIREIDVQQLFREVMSRVNASLQGRVVAIEKLAEYAEPKASDFYNSTPPRDAKDPFKGPFPKSYFNAKLINRPEEEKEDKKEGEEEEETKPKYNCTYRMDLPLLRNDNFKADVNMNVSSVHVPTSIYECDPPLLDALTWSSELEDTFRSNYRDNPSLGWQYFGSSTGFLRQYPAMQWPNDNSEKDAPPDLYDCRFRPWYTASATSPKNLLILLDNSGSMTGLRRRIAKAVVNSILDTLTDNDYVNVFNFSETTDVLVDCTNDTGNPILVQATLKNLRELRVALEQKQTQGQTDWALALKRAFDALEMNKGTTESANCNEAIMIITDGAPQNFKEYFDERNPDKAIRVFTYLVGRESNDKLEVEEMACYNQGYFVHVSTMGEVQEQVVKYLHVMSRPLVLSLRREINWTPVYANHAELVESEWQWQEETREKQKVRAQHYQWFYQNVAQNNKDKGSNKSAIHNFSYGKIKDEKKGVFKLSPSKLKTYLDYGHTNISQRAIRRMEAERERTLRRERTLFKDFELRKFNFVISASYPVFDIRKFTNSTKNTNQERIANLLGVVGTDVSIEELKNLATPFELGVNAYAFAINNNGHIIFHPDFRPLYENILKPTYNSLDLSEVELVDEDGLHRNNDSALLEMRNEMIEKEDAAPSERKLFSIRVHRDSFKRVGIRNQEYVFGKVPRTLYTLAIQVPLNSTVYNGEIELTRVSRDKIINIVESYFDTNLSFTDEDGEVKMIDRSWRLHPSWIYCHYLTPFNHSFALTKEDTFTHFIKRIQAAAHNVTWKWNLTNEWSGKEDDHHYVCNKKLVQSVVFDAMITKPFSDTGDILTEPKIKSFVKATPGAVQLNEGVLTTLVATRSGLTRWVNHPKNIEKPTDLPFAEFHPRTIEESWYERSVERAAIDEDSYVVSVPFDAGTQNFSRVTVTRAVMASKGGKKAPAAVVGVQYDLDKFIGFFGIGPEARADEHNVCSNGEFHCFLLDENAFVIGSSGMRDDSGQFFGEVDQPAMEALINSSIYKEIRVVDFQGICFQEIIRTSLANTLLNPFRGMLLILNWAFAYMVSFFLRLNFPMILNFSFASMDSAEYEEEDDDDNSGDRNMPFVKYAYVNKTKLSPCDMEYKLYKYGDGYSVERGRTTLHRRRARVVCDREDNTCDDYLNVQRIPHTNLIMVIVEAKCRCNTRGDPNRRTITGEKINYGIYRKFVNRTAENPVLLELCQIPQVPLYRKRISHCHAFAEEESSLRVECGWAASLKMSWTLIVTATVTSSSLQLFTSA